MTEARLVEVYADREGARGVLEHACVFLSDAALSGLSAESQAVLLHNAAMAACDAVLQADGYRVTPGDGSHVLRLEQALARIAGDTDELLESLDASRARRNETSYDALPVPQASVDEARAATIELIERVRAQLAS